MQKIYMTMMVLSALGSGSSAWAVDEQSSSDMGTPQTTVAEEKEVTKGYLKKEVIGIKPQVGIVSFKDQQGDTTSRMAGGLLMEGNLAPVFNKDWAETMYLGLSTGLIYSHLGEPTSNFVGTNPDISTGAGGANLLLIPANVKVGYNFTDSFRLSAHGGGNVVYRSVANSLFLGSGSSGGTSSVWRIFPNVGADAEFGLGKNVSLMVRPDFTLTPGDAFFTGTLAVGIPLG